MREAIPIILLLAYLVNGCQTSKTYYIKPSYKEAEPRSVLIIPIQRSWFEGNYEHTFGSLSGTGESAFYTSIGPVLQERIRSEITTIDKNKQLDANLFRSSTLFISEDSITIMLPHRNAEFDTIQPAPDMILLLDQFFYSKRRESSGSTLPGETTRTQYLLYFETKYAFWDNRNKEPVAWGVANASLNISEESSITFPTYLKVLTKAMEKLVSQSPIL